MSDLMVGVVLLIAFAAIAASSLAVGVAVVGLRRQP